MAIPLTPDLRLVLPQEPPDVTFRCLAFTLVGFKVIGGTPKDVNGASGQPLPAGLA